mmetsp:Transcript_23657/g.51715  ORF Transcript_23657/g.51715 Transcript_23657/m.51715 type:complete len:634 (-) Transcript_23657:164-2065(-)
MPRPLSTSIPILSVATTILLIVALLATIVPAVVAVVSTPVVGTNNRKQCDLYLSPTTRTRTRTRTRTLSVTNTNTNTDTSPPIAIDRIPRGGGIGTGGWKRNQKRGGCGNYVRALDDEILWLEQQLRRVHEEKRALKKKAKRNVQQQKHHTTGETNSTTNTNTNTHFLHQDTSHLSPTEKRELSLERLHRLPANQHELKRRSSKKKKVSEADHLAANWIDAVFPSLGSTQDVRRDKFALHTERNAVTYVRGCLLAGVDVDQVNQYGQSALYVAAWRGCIEIVKLLLEYGADPSLPANGGSTVRGLCSAIPRRNNRRVLELMDENQDRDQCNGSSSTATTTTTTSIKYDAGNDADSRLMQFCSRNNQMSPSIPNANGVVLQNDPRLLNTLIPASSDHPGAGSCFIDEAISSDAVNALLELFRSLPVDRDQKQKKNSAPCSDRSYYCDAEGSLRRYLGNVIVGAGVASAAASVESGTNGDGDGDDNGNDDMAVVGNNHPSSATVIADRSESSSSSSVVRVFPHMRFLNYSIPGAVLPPHIDLRHVNPFCRPSDMQNPKHKSTHTFILYLTDCHSGGETRLLQEVTPDGSSPSLATVSPRRGRLLLFPHPTPHEGMEVMDVPKILLRGELQISTNE